VGTVNMRGVFALSPTYDSVAPMAKTAKDLLALTEILIEPPRKFEIQTAWTGLSIGFADPDIWKMADSFCRQYEGTLEQMKSEYEAAISKIRELGATVKYPVTLPEPTAVQVDGQSATGVIAYWEFKHISVPDFIKELSEPEIKSINDIVAFNEKYKKFAMPAPHPDQEELIKASENDDTEENVSRVRRELRKLGIEVLDAVMDEENLDLIVAPSDCSLVTLASAAAYPMAIVPLGELDYNGRPFGMCMLAKAHREDKLFHFMTAYNEAFPQKLEPKFIKDYQNSH